MLLRAIVASLLLAHSILGCCWHHAHECMGSLAAGSLSLDELAHRHSGADGERCDHSDHQHQCLGDRCVYVRGDVSRISDSTATIASVFSPELPPTSADEALTSWRISHERVAAVPLRVHLLHQVLLI